MSWKQIAQSKRETILSSIPTEWRLAPNEIGGRTKQRKVVDLVAKRISSNAREITEVPVSDLLQKLRQGDVTASEVLVRKMYISTVTTCMLTLHPVFRPRSHIERHLPINW